VRDRALRLLELRAGSKAQVEQSDADLKNAAAAVAGAEIELERVRTHLVDFLGVSAEEPGHHQPGEHPGDEDLIPIRAPAAGLILELYVTAGSVVSTSDPIMLIGDLSVVWMLAQVPEEHLASTRVGGSASVMVKAYPHRRFIGRIGRIDPQLDPETRTVQARIDLDNRDGLLKPEMFAAAEMPVAGVRHVLHIPEESIQEVKGQTVVFLKRQARSFEAVAVDTGVSAGGRVEVTGGLKPGDLVVTRGAFLLKAQLLRGSLAEE
jgi:multidrug efflux pump subunit AcrA (membrane-fusion protein)